MAFENWARIRAHSGKAVNSEMVKKTVVTPPQKKKQRTTRSATSTDRSASFDNTDTNEYPLPEPASGKAFSKSEIVEIVGTTEFNSKPTRNVSKQLLPTKIVMVQSVSINLF